VLPLHLVVLLAGIQGLSEALPISRSGHDAVAWLWLDPGPSARQLESILHLATASALLFAARGRLSAAVGAGLLAISRPTLFRSSAPARDAAVLVTACSTSLLARIVVDHFTAPWKTTPVAIGFGLLFTGLLLATTMLVDKVRQDELSVPLAFLLGLTHGMAALPGGSDIGAALVMLAWMGIKNDVALDVAMILSAVTLIGASIQSFSEHFSWAQFSLPLALTAIFTAFLGTTVAIRGTKYLLEKRALAFAACWTVPLGLATLAHSRAFTESFALALSNRPG
jgi:undecaprenyl-diphosphatase